MKPYYQDSAVTIYCGDCREIDAPGTVTVTDPPYNIGFKSQRYSTGYISSNDKMDTIEYLELLNTVINGKSIVTCGKQNLKMWLENWCVTEQGIWIARNKMSGGRISHLSLWEPIVFIGHFDRASRPTDLFEHDTSFQKEADGHPCPKPLGLFLDIIGRYTSIDDTVRDPFMGSGTTLRAAKDLGRKAIGIEIEERYCEIAAKRMAQEVLDLR
jgi:DNA modification methylase